MIPASLSVHGSGLFTMLGAPTRQPTRRATTAASATPRLCPSMVRALVRRAYQMLTGDTTPPPPPVVEAVTRIVLNNTHRFHPVLLHDSSRLTPLLAACNTMPTSTVYDQCRGFKTRAKSDGLRTDKEDRKLEEEALRPLLTDTDKAYHPLVRAAYHLGQKEARKTGGDKKPEKSLLWNISRAAWAMVLFGTFLLLLHQMVTLTMKRGALGFRRSYEVNGEEVSVTFDDVRGIDDIRGELQELVDYLRDPDKYSQLGARLPKGILLVGPPGTGKTLLARAVAGEAGVPFFRASGSEFDEMLVGLGASRLRSLFASAKTRSPAVIFIDEIDSVGAKRVSTSLHPYANQTVNQLLAEMDGFERNEGVIVIGATNRRDDLDPALLRPGRFDVHVDVPAPDRDGRREIFKYYLDKVKCADDVDVEALAKQTVGFVGADIENVVNSAALRAAAEGFSEMHQQHLDEARDRITLGRHRKRGRLPDENSNRITAYHEAGHALVAYFTKDATSIHKVTITPRGRSLGHTAFVPPNDEFYETRAQLLARLDAAMGGRVAEELIFGAENVTSGAQQDFRAATQVAFAMVAAFGMGTETGTRDFTLKTFDTLSGQHLSPKAQEQVDAEVRKLLQESYDRAKRILQTHSREHHALAKALLEHETLDAEQVKRVVEGKSPIIDDGKATNNAARLATKLPKVTAPLPQATPAALASTARRHCDDSDNVVMI